jgi:hypothetical protein
MVEASRLLEESVLHDRLQSSTKVSRQRTTKGITKKKKKSSNFPVDGDAALLGLQIVSSLVKLENLETFILKMGAEVHEKRRHIERRVTSRFLQIPNVLHGFGKSLV